MKTASDVIYWVVLAIWILALIRYSIMYAQMVKAYNALTESLLPLEERISSLEEDLRSFR